MILKIVDSSNNSTIGAVYVYENNENGELTVQDTYHLKTVEHGFDDVFGTNDEQITISIDTKRKEIV